MANLFEKPIAARPMSEFVALPLDFIDRSVQRKQAIYDKAKAGKEGLEDELLKTHALPGDVERQQAILQGFDQKINDIVESVSGDYSRVGGQLDALKQEMQKELAYGEIGAINSAYTGAMTSKADLDKRYADKKIGSAGRTLGMQAISEYQTTQGDDGTWSSFNAYAPSNIVDPIAEMHKSVKEIHAKYDEEGTEFVGDDVVLANLDNKMNSNPEIMKSLVENFKATYPNGSQEDFAGYYDAIKKRIVQDRTYKKVSKSLADKKNNVMMPGTTLRDWQQPKRVSGINESKGGSVPMLRAAGKWLGFDTTDEHDTFIASEEGKRLVEYMEAKTGTNMPTDYMDQVDWLSENAGTMRTSNVIMGEANPKVLQYAITDDGFLNYGGAVYTQDGELESAEDTKAWQGKSEDGNTARIIGVVEEGGMYPKGSYVFIGKDGQKRIQEPGDPDTLRSQSFNMSQINSSRLANTGKTDIKIHSNITSPKTGKVLVPRGDYTSVHDIASGSIILYQNGKAQYIKTIENGVEVIKKVN